MYPNKLHTRIQTFHTYDTFSSDVRNVVDPIGSKRSCIGLKKGFAYQQLYLLMESVSLLPSLVQSIFPVFYSPRSHLMMAPPEFMMMIDSCPRLMMNLGNNRTYYQLWSEMVVPPPHSFVEILIRYDDISRWGPLEDP